VCWISHHGRAIRNIARDDAAGADDRVVAHEIAAWSATISGESAR